MQSLPTWKSLESLSNTRSRECKFTFTIFQILLFGGKLVLAASLLGTGNEKVKFSAKNQKNIRLLLQLLENWLNYKLRRFLIFLILFNPFSTRKTEKLDFSDSHNSTNFKHQ